MENKVVTHLTNQLVEQLDIMDILRDAIGNLEYKDFEDMKWAVREYDHHLEAAEDLLDEIRKLFEDDESYGKYIQSYSDRYHHHFREYDYFSKID